MQNSVIYIEPRCLLNVFYCLSSMLSHARACLDVVFTPYVEQSLLTNIHLLPYSNWRPAKIIFLLQCNCLLNNASVAFWWKLMKNICIFNMRNQTLLLRVFLYICALRTNKWLKYNDIACVQFVPIWMQSRRFFIVGKILWNNYVSFWSRLPIISEKKKMRRPRSFKRKIGIISMVMWK